MKCKCDPEIKTGQTSVMCCNICGLPDEEFWQPIQSEEVKPVSGDWVGMVLDWHKKFGVDIGSEPKMIRPARFAMRHNVLKEEVDELEEAFWLKNKTISDVADAICDILYVIIGTAIEFGLHDKLPKLFAEVHRSNMSKLDENGNPVKREDGKVLKSKLFSPPNLKEILKPNSDKNVQESDTTEAD